MHTTDIQILLTQYLKPADVEILMTKAPTREVTFWSAPSGGIEALTMFPLTLTGYVIPQGLVTLVTRNWNLKLTIPEGHSLVLVDRYEHHPLPAEARPRSPVSQGLPFYPITHHGSGS
jgi:hypothetical protein